LDKNNDTQVTLDEFRNISASLTDPVPPRDMPRLFMHMDTDSDGTLSTDECHRQIGSLKLRLKNTFQNLTAGCNFLDMDGSKKITRSEFVHASSFLSPPMHPADADALFDLLDVNADESISIVPECHVDLHEFKLRVARYGKLDLFDGSNAKHTFRLNAAEFLAMGSRLNVSSIDMEEIWDSLVVGETGYVNASEFWTPARVRTTVYLEAQVPRTMERKTVINTYIAMLQETCASEALENMETSLFPMTTTMFAASHGKSLANTAYNTKTSEAGDRKTFEHRRLLNRKKAGKTAAVTQSQQKDPESNSQVEEKTKKTFLHKDTMLATTSTPAILRTTGSVAKTTTMIAWTAKTYRFDASVFSYNPFKTNSLIHCIADTTLPGNSMESVLIEALKQHLVLVQAHSSTPPQCQEDACDDARLTTPLSTAVEPHITTSKVQKIVTQATPSRIQATTTSKMLLNSTSARTTTMAIATAKPFLVPGRQLTAAEMQAYMGQPASCNGHVEVYLTKLAKPLPSDTKLHTGLRPFVEKAIRFAIGIGSGIPVNSMINITKVSAGPIYPPILEAQATPSRMINFTFQTFLSNGGLVMHRIEEEFGLQLRESIRDEVQGASLGWNTGIEVDDHWVLDYTYSEPTFKPPTGSVLKQLAGRSFDSSQVFVGSKPFTMTVMGES
jgi:hypothetical protein